MKRVIVLIVALGLLPSVYAESVYDSFDAGFSNWLSPNVTNFTYFAISPGDGIGGTDAIDFNTESVQNRGMTKTNVVVTGAAGEVIYLRTDFKFSIDGTPLGDPPNNGVNDGFMGLFVTDTPGFFDGTRQGMQLCRRDGGTNWGFRVPAPDFLAGLNELTDLGFPDNSGSASSSEWNTMEMVLTPTASNYTFSVSVVNENRGFMYSTPTYVSTIPVGTPLYGGYWNAFWLGTNTIQEVVKVDSILFDNFAFGTTALVSIQQVGFEDIIGYEFTSEAGKNHRLQYALDAVTFLNTGASVAGDGTVKTLVDPALDTAGRTYRVTSD